MALRLEEVGLTPESSLLDRARAGDQGAFEELYEHNRDRLYRFCLYQLRSSHDAEDVVQEAFAKAWKALPAMVGDAFYPWLRVIARNLCADVGRRRARVEPMSEIELGYVDDHQEVLASRSDVEVLRLALERLPERHRLALQMREQDELSYQEIAERAGITLGTVESLLWRARQGLKRQFQLVSGEGALAGVPGIGWALVRLRRWTAAARTRASNWITSVPSGVLSSPIAAVALGSALAVGGAWGASPAPVVVGALPPAAQVRTFSPSVSSPTSVPKVTPALAAAPTEAGSTGMTAPAGRRRLVRSSYSEAASGARSDPIHADALGVSAGLDPAVAQADADTAAAKAITLLTKGTP